MIMGAEMQKWIVVVFFDFLGSVFLALGLYGLLAESIIDSLFFLNLKENAWLFIGGGLLLMVPLVIHFIKQAQTK